LLLTEEYAALAARLLKSEMALLVSIILFRLIPPKSGIIVMMSLGILPSYALLEPTLTPASGPA
jgi:hypothetical protein